jgi:hypothetical protein
LRIRVFLPLNDPLPTGFLLQHASKPPAKITYQFEHLSEFFFYACGRLGHLSAFCPLDPCPLIIGRYDPKLKVGAPYVNRVELLHSSKKLAVSMAASSSRAQTNLSIVSTQSAEANGSLQLNTVHVSSHSLSQQVSPTNPPTLSPSPFPTTALMEKSPIVKIQMSPITSHLRPWLRLINFFRQGNGMVLCHNVTTITLQPFFLTRALPFFQKYPHPHTLG